MGLQAVVRSGFDRDTNTFGLAQFREPIHQLDMR